MGTVCPQRTMPHDDEGQYQHGGATIAWELQALRDSCAAKQYVREDGAQNRAYTCFALQTQREEPLQIVTILHCISFQLPGTWS